jgi:hypothetical protein
MLPVNNQIGKRSQAVRAMLLSGHKHLDLETVCAYLEYARISRGGREWAEMRTRSSIDHKNFKETIDQPQAWILRIAEHSFGRFNLR